MPADSAASSSIRLKPKQSTDFEVYQIDGEERQEITADKETSYQVSNSRITIKKGESVITVSYQGSDDGELTANQTGTSTITVVYGYKWTKMKVLVVEEKTPADFRINRSRMRLTTGETKQVMAIAKYKRDYQDDVNEAAEWTSADEEVATVKNGEVTAVGAGRTTVTVSYGNFTKTFRVIVSK